MSSTPARAVIRPAAESDAGRIHELIVELATYERSEHLVRYDETRLKHSLFGPDPDAEALVAEVEGRVEGYALYYRSFSTWEGPGLYLEDLYVVAVHRGLGLGGSLLRRLAELTLARGYARLEWAVLDWNSPAIGFYDRVGAESLDEWTVRRLSGPALRAYARSAP